MEGSRDLRDRASSVVQRTRKGIYTPLLFENVQYNRQFFQRFQLCDLHQTAFN